MLIQLCVLSFQYIDKTIAEAETSLTADDFKNIAELSPVRPKRQLLMVGEPNDVTIDEEELDESGMYNADRFEGDIGESTFWSFVGCGYSTFNMDFYCCLWLNNRYLSVYCYGFAGMD